MEKLLEIFPMIWLILIASAYLIFIGFIFTLFAFLIDWIFKPKHIFFHVLANIISFFGEVPFVIAFVLIMIDRFIYDFIRPF